LGNPRSRAMVRGETIMPVPSGKITTTKIMQGLEKSPEPVPDEEKEIVKE
jgi:hypothetical protein